MYRTGGARHLNVGKTSLSLANKNVIFSFKPSVVATTGPSVYYNQSPAYNSQYLLRTAANVTPTKVIITVKHLILETHFFIVY